ncbi:MAG: C10 family peptidase, partial [Bacteroides sp.]|nr:C10 family peptidase [Bacteroides sp.]
VYLGDTVMYLVNFENNKGWMILSADKRVDPILTAHDKGNFRQENSNEGLNSWFTTIAQDISYLKKNIKENTNPEAYKIWGVMDRAANTTPEMQAYFEKKYGIIPPDHYDIIKKNGKRVAQIKSRYASKYQDQYIFLVRRYIGTTVTEPVKRTIKLLPTKWGQGSPWSDGQFPNVKNDEGAWVTPPAGCVAVAMGQVLYALHNRLGKPNGLYHNVSYSGYIYDSKNYDTRIERTNYNANSPLWEQMALNKYEIFPERINMVGDFLEDLGYRLDMKYTANGSGAKPTPAHFKEWGITCEEGDYDRDKVLSQLRSNRVVMMSGYADKKTSGVWPFQTTTYSKGHSWVIDGYEETISETIITYRWEYATRCPDEYNSGGYYDPYQHPCNDPWGYEHEDIDNPCSKPCDAYIYPGDAFDGYGNWIDWDFEHYPGEIEEFKMGSATPMITINWGYDGKYNGAYHAHTNNNWQSNEKYQYKQSILYNFR